MFILPKSEKHEKPIKIIGNLTHPQVYLEDGTISIDMSGLLLLRGWASEHFGCPSGRVALPRAKGGLFEDATSVSQSNLLVPKGLDIAGCFGISGNLVYPGLTPLYTWIYLDIPGYIWLYLVDPAQLRHRRSSKTAIR